MLAGPEQLLERLTPVAHRLAVHFTMTWRIIAGPTPLLARLK